MANYNKSFNFRNGVQVDDDNFIVNANGLVGIGTSIPTEILDVHGTAKITGLVTATSLAVSGVSNFHSNVGVGTEITFNSSTGIISATSFVGDGAGLSGIYAIAVDGWIINAGNLSTTSKVGIGSLIPSSPLDVLGDVNLVGITTLTGDLDVNGSAELDNVNISGVSTFVGVTTNQSTIFGTQLSVSGVSTFSSFITAPSLRDYNSLVGTASSTTTTFVVTVAAKTTNHRYYGTGSANAYVIDDIESPFITLLPGKTYRFTQEGASNSGHPLRFYYEAAKTTQYSTNVTTSGTPGTAGAYTEIVVTDTTPVVLHYQCSVHGYMGNAAKFNSNVVDTPYQITTSSGLSVTGVSTFTGASTFANTVSIAGITTITGSTLFTQQLGVSGVATISTRLYAESIGVGTNSPSSDIHIRRSSASTLQVTSDTAAAIIAVGRSTTLEGNNGAIIFGNTAGIYPYSDSRTLDIVNYDTGSLNYYLNYSGSGGSNGDFNWIYTPDATNPLMTLTYGGNLGIGITNPTSKLQVSGIASVTSLVTGDITATGNVDASVNIVAIGAGSSISVETLYVYGGKSQILNSD